MTLYVTPSWRLKSAMGIIVAAHGGPAGPLPGAVIGAAMPWPLGDRHDPGHCWRPA